MKSKFLLLLAVLLFFCADKALAQQLKSPSILSIDNDQVTLEEFENIYRKNNRDSAITRESLDEYMELFINFKLKVKEARELGLDTVTQFVEELRGYRSQLARPYLTDGDLLNDLIKEAYERQKTEIRASHILVNCDPSASPEDTLKAYNRILQLRERITKGEDFTSVAKGIGGSEDPSVKDNGGDLGYFTAFQMVYPFEEAAYTTPVGSVSKPVRTKYGYHTLLVKDKRPAQGEMHVAHIMLKDKKDPQPGQNAETKCMEIYQKLKAGENFEQLASQFSEDGSSAKKGGELPWFGTGKMVAEFESASFALKNDGDISAPFKTQYGWHVVKRLGYKPVPPFSEVEKDLKSKVSKDQRADKTRSSFIAKLKKQYGFTYFENNVMALANAADTSVFSGKLTVKKKALKKPMYALDGNKHAVKELHNYLTSRSKVRTKFAPKDYVLAEAVDFCDDAIIAYEDSKLEKKHDAFRLLMNEYHEGILLFELTDRKVWSKAVKDSVGLQEFYDNNQDKFLWPERVEAVIYTCATPAIAAELRTALKAGKEKSAIAGELNKQSQLNLQIDEGLFSKEDKEVLAQIAWKKGLSENMTLNSQIVIVDVLNVMTPTPKKLEEARGLVTSEYQNYLEQEWIRELRSKHSYVVNKDVLYSIR